MKRSVLCLVVVLLLGGSIAPGAIAGGWAIVELAEPVSAAVAGEEITVQFRVLGHGKADAALKDIDATILLIHRESTARKRVAANATAADPTLYEASFTLKDTGAYKWNITPAPYAPTAMPTLTVYASAAEMAEAESAKADGAVTAVTIGESFFTPAMIEVAPGSTVEWTNTSVLPHQVVWSDLSLDDSAILDQDGTFRVTFDAPGTYQYYCGPHPYMTGTIVVTEDAESTPQS